MSLLDPELRRYGCQVVNNGWDHHRAAMCSRYDLTTPPEAVRAFFGYLDKPNFPPRDNIRPTEALRLGRVA